MRVEDGGLSETIPTDSVYFSGSIRHRPPPPDPTHHLVVIRWEVYSPNPSIWLQIRWYEPKVSQYQVYLWTNLMAQHGVKKNVISTLKVQFQLWNEWDFQSMFSGPITSVAWSVDFKWQNVNVRLKCQSNLKLTGRIKTSSISTVHLWSQTIKQVFAFV